MRRLLTVKWLAWHVLVVLVAVTFVRLGLWQWHRAVATGSAQNMGYALQWPVFALFAVFFWCRTVRDALRPEADGAPVPRAKRARRPAPQPAAPVEVTDEEDPELAAYNRYLAQLNQSAEARGDRR